MTTSTDDTCLTPVVRFAAAVTVLIMLAGTADGIGGVPGALVPQRLSAGYARLNNEGDHNQVLNEMRLGLDAMQLGNHELAKACFDAALAGVQRVFANDPQAQKARSLWYEEGCKTFKGEPYERVMAYYYGGILFMMDGDYENARACFKSAALQDAFAEEQQHRCDFALPVFLEGWASQVLHDTDLMRPAYDEVRRLRPDFVLPESGDNVLVLIETGKSPRKLADGPGHAELKFRRGRDFEDARSEVALDNSEHYRASYPMEDIAWQAMTRGGRAVDKILNGKAQFRQTNENMGTALTDVAAEAMLNWTDATPSSHGVEYAAAALGLIGVAQLAVSASTKPHADTRYWDNLPDAVQVATLRLAKGDHALTVRFLNRDGQSVGVEKTLQVAIPEDGTKRVVWVRSCNQISSDSN